MSEQHAEYTSTELTVEQRVDFSRYVGEPDQTGTSDNNKQLLFYAFGTYDMASLLPSLKVDNNVRTTC